MITLLRKETLMSGIFGQNWETTLGAIFTAIGIVPQAIQSLELTQVPGWLRTVGMVCAFLSFIYTGIMAKSKNVTGTGINAHREDR
jgi:hypothetical protein